MPLRWIGLPPFAIETPITQIPENPRSRRFRLHWSTCVLAAVTTAALAAFLWRGEGMEMGEGGMPPNFTSGIAKWEHGWPMPYLERRIPHGYGLPTDALDRSSAWGLFTGEQSWNKTALLVDLFVAAICALAATLIWERAVRRHFQVSLRTAFLATAVCAVASNWWVNEKRTSNSEHEIIRRLESEGHSCYVRYTGPLWLRRLFGPDVPIRQRVVFVEVDPVAALANPDNFVECLRNPRSLHGVVFTFDDDESMPMEVIQLLSRVESIREIDLTNTITYDLDTAKAFLSSMNVEGLYLDDIKDEDAVACMQALASSATLRRLELNGLGISDEALSFLSQTRGLYELNLLDAMVTDAAVASLAKCDSLRRLNLCGTNVSDEGVRALSRSPGLTELNLSDTEVTESGLMSLVDCPSLKRLIIASTDASDEGIAELRRARPDIDIQEWDATEIIGISGGGRAGFFTTRPTGPPALRQPMSVPGSMF